MPGERHGNDPSKGFRQERGAAAMGQPVRLAGNEHEGDGVEDAEASPHQKHRRDLALRRDGVDDAPEQDRFGNRDGCQNDVGEDDRRDTKLVNRKILERSCIHLEQ
ncbi:hypothetical protein D9M70_542100 [compost metagenome]